MLSKRAGTQLRSNRSERLLQSQATRLHGLVLRCLDCVDMTLYVSCLAYVFFCDVIHYIIGGLCCDSA
jgi:hypothetical protein